MPCLVDISVGPEISEKKRKENGSGGEGVERSGGSGKHEQDIFYKIRMYFH